MPLQVCLCLYLVNLFYHDEATLINSHVLMMMMMMMMMMMTMMVGVQTYLESLNVYHSPELGLRQ